MLRISLVLICAAFISACSERHRPAPVVELNWRTKNLHQASYRVVKGDTLYSIAFRYDRDYRQLAASNHLQRPYRLNVGQVLQFHTVSAHHDIPVSASRPVYRPSRAAIVERTKPRLVRTMARSGGKSQWTWPARGKIISGFVPDQGKKGLDIAGKKGAVVHAAADGVVAYSGSGLSGYGNLIIIKHAGQFLTAYGNNARNLVREGQKVKAGQDIAEMGMMDRKYWGVHFEIRKAGQPVNPVHYLG